MDQQEIKPMTTKTYFDQVAPQWETMRQSFFTEKVCDKALALARVEAGKIAADIGAGTGFITMGLVQAGLQVIAVDQSEIMLAEMRQRFAEVDQIDYRLGDGETLPVEEASCDYAFANMYLHHTEQPDQAIKEIARILKPGGALVITDLDEYDEESLRDEHYDCWMGFKREDIRRWFSQAGFRNVQVADIGENCCQSSGCGSQPKGLSMFVASGEKKAA
jgi:ubiquinone/menaquinone biosynthesis C-methylase UbiE